MAQNLRELSDVERLRASLRDLPEPASHPFLVLVGGLPATGKSYFCRRLAQRVPAVILESDALRRVLVPLPTYSGEESRRLFLACQLLIEDLLASGIPAILDATNLQEPQREQFYRAAARTGARLVVVWVEAPPELVRERMKARQSGFDPEDKSEAGWDVYAKMSASAEPPRRSFFRVNTSRDIEPVVEKVARAIRSTAGS